MVAAGDRAAALACVVLVAIDAFSADLAFVHAGESTSQADVFEDVRFIISSVLGGCNGTIMGKR